MNRAALVAALLVVAATAQADDETEDRPSVASTASVDRVVAIAVPGDDVRAAILVGPSGQVYEPDGKGAWTRSHGGGVAADVTGATTVDGDLVVTGRAAPMYRRDGTTWFAMPIGESGKTALSRGPAAAVAIGKKVFVLKKGKWSRVGSIPGRVTAVWASGPKAVWAQTDSTLYRLKGSDFVTAGDAMTALGGAEPWGIAADGTLRDLDAGKSIPGDLDGATVTAVAIAGADADLRAIVQTAGGLVLARVVKGALQKVDDLPGTGRVVGMAVGDGRVLVVMADGTVALRDQDAWTTSQVKDALPAAGKGPGPAHTR